MEAGGVAGPRDEHRLGVGVSTISKGELEPEGLSVPGLVPRGGICCSAGTVRASVRG